VRRWSKESAASLSRAEKVLELLRAENDQDYAMFSVVLQEFQMLAQQTVVKN